MSGIALFRRRKKDKDQGEALKAKLPVTVQAGPAPAPLVPIATGQPRWTVANLQEQGAREAQQDAFALSQLDKQDSGLYLILADGMGGIRDGGLIAQNSVEAVARTFLEYPDDFDAIPAAFSALSSEVYGRYAEQGGATLIACHIHKGLLRFASVGDSFLYLLRDGTLIRLNRRHTWRTELFDQVLAGRTGIRQAVEDAQGHALASFVGAQRTEIDRSYTPVQMHRGDTLMLCSDGVGDALPEKTLADCMALGPQACCEKLYALISAKADPGQDNYTAILAAYT